MSNLAPLPSLTESLVVPNRNQLIQWWLRDYQLHSPNSRIDPGSEPYLKATVAADSVTPLFYDATLIAKNTSRATMVGQALDDEAKALGTQRLPAIGASGAVIITAYSAGTTIFAGDKFVIGSNTYVCMATALYLSGAQVPIQGSSTGPGTNQDPGTIGVWSVPRPGCALKATIATQSDGSGLDGGHLIESDDELRQRLDFLAANPPASGNDAQIQELMGRCPGLSVEQAFTYPCAQGPSSTCCAFTMRASSLGASRIPNPTQLALMQAWLQGPGQLPADLTITVGAIVANPVPVVLRPSWAVGFPGWVDASVWPAFTSIGSEPQIATPSSGPATSTFFRVINAATAPSIGQSVALYSPSNQTFYRKKILSFVTDGGGGYDITVDTTSGVSDMSFVPKVGQFVSPWSDSLATLNLPVETYFASLGPGEQFASFPDPGSRQRRNPSSPAAWPSSVAARMLAGPANLPVVPQGQPVPAPTPTLATLTSLLDVTITEPVIPFPTPVGSPGIASNLIILGDLSAYPP